MTSPASDPDNIMVVWDDEPLVEAVEPRRPARKVAKKARRRTS